MKPEIKTFFFFRIARVTLEIDRDFSDTKIGDNCDFLHLCVCVRLNSCGFYTQRGIESQPGKDGMTYVSIVS